MSEDTQESSMNTDELTSLKQKADLMGIKYHPSIGLDKLRDKVNEKLEPTEDKVDSTPAKKVDGKVQPLTHAQFQQIEKQRRKTKAGSLVRVRITNMNPATSEQETTFISAGSSKLGTYKRYIPFNEPWHIENILYEALKEKKCSTFYTVKGPRGDKIRKSKLIPEFAIEVLPPLTKEELAELKQQQVMSGSIDK